MSTYYGDVMSDEEVRDMVERALGTAERACGLDVMRPAVDERELKLRELKLAEIAAVREIVTTQMGTFRGDEFRSNGPAQRLAGLIGYRKEE